MKDMNDKIRNSIANSYRLRELAKDDTLSKEKCIELNHLADENDKRILFYKKLSNALKETQKNDIGIKSK